MLTRRLVACALAVALVGSLSIVVQADEPVATTTTLKAAEVSETTQVLGTIPADIVGRWLTVGSIKLPSGIVRPVPRALEIRQGPEHLEVLVGRHPLPDSVNKKVAAASEAGKPYVPDAEDLRAVDETWGKLPKIEVNYSKIENKILGPDKYPPEFADDETTKGAMFAITTHEHFAGGTATVRSFTVYGVRELKPGQMGGNYLTSTIAAAPMPIPIVLKGDFQAYRVNGGGTAPGTEPSGSWLDRLFAGCHR